jgi:peptidoglycan/LPS O-acetylase OafA/YrhL
MLGPADAAAMSRGWRRRASTLDLLRAVLLAQAAGGVVIAILLSLVATGLRDLSPDDVGADTGVRFVAAGAFVVGIAAAIAARGVRRRRAWSWMLAVLVQLALAFGTAAAVLLADWHPGYLLGFVVAALAMVVLSAAPVRRGLGQL